MMCHLCRKNCLDGWMVQNKFFECDSCYFAKVVDDEC